MGLDMYLESEYYVRNYEHEGNPFKVSVTFNGKPYGPTVVTSVCGEVAYWRKANAIHNWFVQNCQGGNDDCQRHYVNRKQLIELMNLCKEVYDKAQFNKDGIIENPDELAELLPPVSGFFFGNDEVDLYYIREVKRTYEILKEELEEEEDCAYYYQSSW